VSRVFVESPADRSGLRARDVVVAFDGQPVTGLRGLIDAIRSHEPGSWVSMTVQRQGDELDLDARLTSRPAVIKKNAMRHGWIGVETIDLPESLREHFGAPAEAGVMISEVIQGSPAEAAGFRLGDVVYEVGEDSVGSRQGFGELIGGGGVGNVYEFAVARDGALLVLESMIQGRPAEGS
jgi:serine protease Do